MVDALSSIGASSGTGTSGTSGSSTTPFADLSDIGNDTTQFGSAMGPDKKKEGLGKPLASLAATIGGMVALHRFGPGLAEKDFVKRVGALVRQHIPGGNRIVDFIKGILTKGAKAAKTVVEDGTKVAETVAEDIPAVAEEVAPVVAAAV